MEKKSCDGFALIEVMVLIMIILIFLTSLFGSARFHHHAALMRLQKEAAVCAAKTALELMETEARSEECRFAEHGLKKTKTVLEFESENGESVVKIPVVVWAKRNKDELVLYAEAEVGNRKEELSVVLDCPIESFLATGSDPELATPSTAGNGGVGK